MALERNISEEVARADVRAIHSDGSDDHAQAAGVGLVRREKEEEAEDVHERRVGEGDC